jgi:hypothetical protein
MVPSEVSDAGDSSLLRDLLRPWLDEGRSSSESERLVGIGCTCGTGSNCTLLFPEVDSWLTCESAAAGILSSTSS